MARKLQFTESALQDLLDMQAYYTAEGVSEIGVKFTQKIMAHTEQLLVHPISGRIVPEFQTENLRELIHPPFRVVYRLKEADVQIIRVWRSERLLSVDG